MTTRRSRSRRRPRAGAASPGPVRLLAPGLPSPFAPGRDVTFARVLGDVPEGAGLRDGDHVALVRRAVARDGTVASVLAPDGTETIYRFPDQDRGRDGDPDRDPDAEIDVPPAAGEAGRRMPSRSPRVRGVVVGVLRKLAASA